MRIQNIKRTGNAVLETLVRQLQALCLRILHTALRFNLHEYVALDHFMLKRKGAEAGHSAAVMDKAKAWFDASTQADRDRLLASVMAGLLARGERERDPLLRAWRRLDRRYARLGLGRQPHEPAEVWAERVEASRPGSGLAMLSRRFSDARYAGALSDLASLLRDLHRHRPQPGVRTGART